MKIATWNLESSNPLTPPRKAAFLDAMRKVNADVWVLTETWTNLLPPPAYKLVAQSGPAADMAHERCWVAIWAKSSITAKRLDIKSQQDRMAWTRLTQPGQRDIVVVGTVLPWPNDPQWPGAKGFCNALDAQAREWKRLRGKPETCALVVAGDFNQSFPYQRYYGSKDGANALSKPRPDLDLDCLTSGDDPQTGKPRIDHICISRCGPPPPLSPRIDTWKVPCIGKKPITDHAGVSADLS